MAPSTQGTRGKNKGLAVILGANKPLSGVGQRLCKGARCRAGSCPQKAMSPDQIFLREILALGPITRGGVSSAGISPEGKSGIGRKNGLRSELSI